MADRVRVFTFKEGLLSRVAHDLRLHVEPWGLKITRTGDGFLHARDRAEQVTAEIDPRALVVDGAVRDGRVDATALDDRDRTKIVETIHREILALEQHPKIRFSGTASEGPGNTLEVRGELRLVGVTRPLSFAATREHRRIRARVTLRPSDWGIRPYKALAGAIRLQDRVVIEIDVDNSSRPGDRAENSGQDSE